MSRRRHQGIEASRRQGARVAFSLIEVLLAVFILGVGVIAIAALFPAGIAQQRQSVDDTIGPIVANNALAVLRSKLRIEDFGFGFGYTVEGDFAWSRPAFFTQPATLGGSVFVSAGSISIFDTVGMGGAGAITPSEIPYIDPAAPPDPPIIITQSERYYPMRSQFSTDPFPPRPQYVWDCMFRRFQGKVLVAIFVYRVTIPGGGAATYVVAPGPSAVPPLPAAIDLTTTTGGAWDVFGEDGVPSADDAVIPGTQPDSPLTFYTPVSLDGFSLDAAMNQGWQAPGQWMLDQNNNVHRVLSGRRNKADGPVELVRPVSWMPPLRVYFMPDVVTNIWYIPPVDGNGLTVTPVYVTVREL